MCEDAVLSEACLISLATATAVVGARRSCEEEEEEEEASSLASELDGSSAAVFPALASAALVGIYVLFARFQGVLVSAMAFASLWSLHFTARPYVGGLAWPVAGVVVCCWLLTGHWVLLDVLGACTCVACVALVRVPNLRVACLCLGSLLAYDVFWILGSASVFGGDNVMVTVASRAANNPVGPPLQLPIKLVVPACSGFSLLGLGDVAIPGLALALARRFDRYLAAEARSPVAADARRWRRPDTVSGRRSSITAKRPRRLSYLAVATTGYAGGLALACATAARFGPQPALVYLVPACVLPIIVAALLRGNDHLKLLWRGLEEGGDEDHPEEKSRGVN
ncbi:hypothetical protein CTAYLR_003996 [Chrysophaeum taylorii]|uniref:Uncharacterized protein n=1 Tax=Chrysophaeum taylorii TaxID=2483200 RepID=A0AAD7UA23_9STRA|nr:hypothetical protein CTAYLR_003996 [Chrysophaeum taylorii]